MQMIRLFVYTSLVIFLNTIQQAYCHIDQHTYIQPAHHSVVGWVKEITEHSPYNYLLKLDVGGQEKVYKIRITGKKTFRNSIASLALTNALDTNSFVLNTKAHDPANNQPIYAFLDYARQEFEKRIQEKRNRDRAEKQLTHCSSTEDLLTKIARIKDHLNMGIYTTPYVTLFNFMKENAATKTFSDNNERPYIFMQYNTAEHNPHLDGELDNKNYQEISLQNLERIMPLHAFSRDPFHTASELYAWQYYTAIPIQNTSEKNQPQSLDSKKQAAYEPLLSIPQITDHSVFSKAHYHIINDSKWLASSKKKQYHHAYIVHIQDIDNKYYTDFIKEHGHFSPRIINPAIITFIENQEKKSVYTEDPGLIEFAKAALKSNVYVTLTSVSSPCKNDLDRIVDLQKIKGYPRLQSIALSFQARVAISLDLPSLYPAVSSRTNQWIAQPYFSPPLSDHIPEHEISLQAQSKEFDQEKYHLSLSSLMFPSSKPSVEPSPADHAEISTSTQFALHASVMKIDCMNPYLFIEQLMTAGTYFKKMKNQESTLNEKEEQYSLSELYAFLNKKFKITQGETKSVDLEKITKKASEARYTPTITNNGDKKASSPSLNTTTVTPEQHKQHDGSQNTAVKKKRRRITFFTSTK